MDDLLFVPKGSAEVSIFDAGKFIDDEATAQFLLDKINNGGISAQVINLSGNSIGKGGAEAIAPTLAKMMDLKYLKFDDMFRTRSKTEIPPTMRILLDAVVQSGAQILYLDLADNAVGPVGIEGLKDFLSSSSMFNVYYLNLNNGGWGSSSQEIAKRLIECHRSSLEAGTPFKLRTFIAGRSRFENLGAISMAEAFKIIGTLEYISMPQNGIYCPGITALCNSLSQNPNLRHLDLSDNTITWRGALPLSQALKHCNNLENLLLADCLIKSKGLRTLYEVLKLHLPKLKNLNLAGNELTADDALQLIKLKSEKSTLESLDIHTNCYSNRYSQVKKAFEATNMKGGVGDEEDDQGSADEYESDGDEGNAISMSPPKNGVSSDQSSEVLRPPLSSQSEPLRSTLPPVFSSVNSYVEYVKSINDPVLFYDRIAVLVRQLVTIGEKHVEVTMNSQQQLMAREAAFNESNEYLDPFFEICRQKWGNMEIQLTMVNLLLAHLGFIKCENPLDTFPVKNKYGVYCLIIDLMQDSAYFMRQWLVIRKYLLEQEARLGLPNTPATADMRHQLETILSQFEAEALMS